MRSLENISDEELVKLVCNKDKEIYSELVKRYQYKLVRYAYYLTSNLDDSYDIVEEAFIKAYINLKGFDTNKKFSSWIYRIVHNEAINQLRSKRFEIQESQEILDSIEDTSPSPEERFDRNELKEYVERSLDKLPLKYRECLSLYYIDDYSYDEISEILKMPIGTVGTNISRGKKMLAVILKKEEKLDV